MDNIIILFYHKILKVSVVINYIGIFQAGGIKGIAHIGAVTALEERGFKCVKAAGTSVGAVIACLLIAGYSGKELKEIALNLDLETLRQKGKLIQVFKDLGLYSPYPLERYLDKLLQAKNIKTYQDIKKGNEYPLKVVATDITRKKEIVFPDSLKEYYKNPDTFPISQSVVMSATYPLFYKPLRLNNNLIVDGAVVNNFPCNLFDSDNQLTIGFTFQNEKRKNKSTIPYLISIELPKVRSMNFKVNKEIQYQLFIAGYKAGKKFVESYFSS